MWGIDYDAFVHTANDYFRGRGTPSLGVGLLFAPFGAELTKQQVIPRLGQLHYATADDLIICCAGYSSSVSGDPVAYRDPKTHEEWSYSDALFQDFVDEVRKWVPRWKYSGEVDLLLAPWGAPYSGWLQGPDFAQGIEVRLTEAIAAGSILSIPAFVQDLLNSEQEFRRYQRFEEAGSWASAILATLVSLLPMDATPLLERKSIVRKIT